MCLALPQLVRAMLTAMVNTAKVKAINDRARQLSQWLEDKSPYARFDQRHLDDGTPEQAYWHFGYKEALRDVIALLNDSDGDTPDTSTRFPLAGRGE